MFFNIPTFIFPLILLGGIIAATPLEIRDVKIVEAPGVNVSTLKLPSPATTITRSEVERAPLPAGASITSPNSAFHALARTAVEQFVACPSLDCSGECYGWPLSSLSPPMCYSTTFYYTSFYIYQESNLGLPYGIYVGLKDCLDPAQVPSVNACYYSVDRGGNIRNNLLSFYRTF